MMSLEDLSILQMLGLLFTAVFISTLLYQRYLSPISDIPGPFLASFGTCWQLLQISKGRISDVTLDLHKKHGIFLRLSYNEVSINHPEALSAVLAAPLRKGDYYKLFAIPNISYNNMMSERDYKRNVALRANVAPAYSLSNIIRNEPYIDRTITLMEQRLDEVSKDGKSVELGKWIHFLTWDILGEITFSKRFGFLDEARDVGNSIANTFALAFYVTTAGYIQWLHALLLGNPLLRWLDVQPAEHTWRTSVAALNERKRSSEARVDMVEQWMNVRAKHPERMSDKDIMCAVTANVGAGGDTVAIGLQAFFYFLLKHPTHLARLREEIDASNSRGELSPVVTLTQAQNLPYLQACIKETLRLFPSVPWNLPRVVPKEGLTVAGHHFKSGTILSVNPYVIHRSEQIFGPDAHIYNPERWLDPQQSKTLEKFLIPFGLGYNSCPGRNVANLELNKISATLTRDFDFELVDPDKEWQYHTLFIAVPYDWPVYVRRRGDRSVAVNEKHDQKAEV